MGPNWNNLWQFSFNIRLDHQNIFISNFHHFGQKHHISNNRNFEFNKPKTTQFDQYRERTYTVFYHLPEDKKNGQRPYCNRAELVFKMSWCCKENRRLLLSQWDQKIWSPTNHRFYNEIFSVIHSFQLWNLYLYEDSNESSEIYHWSAASIKLLDCSYYLLHT